MMKTSQYLHVIHILDIKRSVDCCHGCCRCRYDAIELDDAIEFPTGISHVDIVGALTSQMINPICLCLFVCSS